MGKSIAFLNKKKWLEEGFIIQTSDRSYFLGQGPFSRERRPQPQTLYHPDFFLESEKPWLRPSLVCRAGAGGLKAFLFDRTAENRCPPELQSLGGASAFNQLFQRSKKPSFIQYQSVFFQARQAMQRGELQKAVPVFCESFACRPPLPLLIKNLFKKAGFSPYGFLYGAWNKSGGILGWTPEILFSFKERRFRTMALAGTGACPGPSLLKDKKELKEHDFAVQGIKESLKSFVCWRDSSAYEALFPPLKHLRTDLKGRLSQNFDFEALCKALHPTAALGGYPKKSAGDWLKNRAEQKKRSYFGAPFGFFSSPKEAFCLIAIRALEWDQTESRIFSGGGLIKESCLQKEWRELFLKREQVKGFFQL